MPPLKAPILAADPGISDVVLSWTITGPQPDSFTMYRNAVQIGSVLAGTTRTYTDSTVAAGSTYTYQVKAKRTHTILGSNIVSVTLDTVPVPTTAPALTATAGSEQVSMAWTAVESADSYTLERKTGAGAYSVLLEQAGLTYVNTGLTNGTTYTWRVRGTANAGADVGPWSNELTRTPGATLPVAPVLTGEAGDSENSLDWNAVVNATTYRLRRTVNGVTSSFSDMTETAYIDDTAANGTFYQYAVRGITAAGALGALSNTVDLIPVAAAPAPTPTAGVFIAPTGNDANAGTITSPMRTILAASAKLMPGQTLWCRGGTYTGQGGYNWKKSGTATAPVTIKAYPDEIPLFSGASPVVSHGLIISGYSWVVVDGLHFTGFGRTTSGDGAILLLNATDIIIRNVKIMDTGVTTLDHSIYVNSGTNRITIQDSIFYNSRGTHIVLNHAPGPLNVIVERCDIGNPDGSEQAYGGVVVACTATGCTSIVRDNVFRNISTNYLQKCGSAGATMTATGNSPGNVINGGPAN